MLSFNKTTTKTKQKNEDTNFQVLRGLFKKRRQKSKWGERRIRRQTPRL
jgi:hypothetical protein